APRGGWWATETDAAIGDGRGKIGGRRSPRQFGGTASRAQHLSCDCYASHNRVEGDMMHDTNPRRYIWTRRAAVLGLGGLLFLSGYVTALWAPIHTPVLTVPAQAAEEHHKHYHMAQHTHGAQEADPG